MTQYRVPVLEQFAWQQPVINIALTAPPISPTKGDRYVVASPATDDWATHENSIAWFDGSIWKFDVPAEGWNVYNNFNHREYHFDGAAWVSDDISGKADKVSGATNDHIATLDGTGNLTDSGISKASVQTAISQSHVQGTDQSLDQGGANQISAAQAKKAYTSRAIFDTDLGVLVFNDPDTE